MTIEEEFALYKFNHPFYKIPEWKIYGPYQDKISLRRHLSVESLYKKTSISYPRFIMECILGRLLTDNEDVHHKNGLEFDDRVDNFEIVDAHKHKSDHKTKLPEVFYCKGCGISFIAKGHQLAKIKVKIKSDPTFQPYHDHECYLRNKTGNQYT